MSTDIVQIQTNTSIASSPAGGLGFGGGSGLFRLKPANMELQQKTSRSEGSIEGKFRNGLTGEHYDSLHVVLIFHPDEARSMYDTDEFGKPPLCYSMDAKHPSERAQSPQALSCAGCRHSDWNRWKKSKRPEDLPKCKNRWNMFLVDRVSKIPYKLAVRGKSITPFRKAMDQIAALAELYLAQKGKYPEFFDFSFKVSSIRKVDNKGVYYEMVFTDIGLIKEEDRAQFGELYLKFLTARQNGDLKDEAEQAESAVDDAMSEATTRTEPAVAAAEPEPAQEEVTI